MNKRNNKRKGDAGEEIACAYLKKAGYDILHRNFSTEIGELDIVASDGKGLVFVEVKTRLNNAFGTPAEAVDYRKRRKINAVAAQYIKKFRLYEIPVRFDVVEVWLQDRSVNHIENAFDSYLHY
ncbi:MAG: YraN family protein [Clostridiales bacterium]|nr:YraN family protein [Clostridiales bacterium]